MTAYTLTALVGSFSLSGQATRIGKGFKLRTSAGLISLIPFALSNFAHGEVVATAAYYSVAFDGPTRFKTNGTFLFPAGPSSYTLTGQNAVVGYGRAIKAGSGAFTYTGNSADLVNTYPFVLGTGYFAVDGGDAGLVTARNLSVETGYYVVNPQDVGLLVVRMINAGAGQFDTTGFSARVYFSSYFYADNEKSYAVAERRSIGVDSEDRIVVIEAKPPEQPLTPLRAEDRSSRVVTRSRV